MCHVGIACHVSLYRIWILHIVFFGLLVCLCSFFSVSLGFSPCVCVCVCSQITALSWQNTKQCWDDKIMTMITFHDTLLQLYHTDETKWKCKFNDCLSIFVQLQTTNESHLSAGTFTARARNRMHILIAAVEFVHTHTYTSLYVSC